MIITSAGDPPDEIDPPGDDELEVASEAAGEEAGEVEELSLEDQLQVLLIEHRQLDQHISQLQNFPYKDQLEIQRLKKKKLQLKDAISYLKDQIIPDWNA